MSASWEQLVTAKLISLENDLLEQRRIIGSLKQQVHDLRSRQ